MGSDSSYQLNFSDVVSSPLKESLSDSFLPSYNSAAAIASKRSNSNRRTSVSPTNDPWQSVPKTDPWQSVPKTNVTDVPDGTLPVMSSPPAWAPFSTSVTASIKQEANGHVTLDPWSSNTNKKSSNPAPKRKSTNPWANDVSEVNIAQSVAPTRAANANAQQNDAFLFDPLKSDWMKDDDKFSQPKQDPSDLFGNWDTAVKQMHQLPSYSAPHTYNAWPQQNQMISTGQAFTTPSLI